MLETLGNLLDAQERHAGGGQLKGERQAVELGADARDRLPAARPLRVKARCHLADALDEQLRRAFLAGVGVRAGRRRATRARDGQALDAPDLLARDAEGLSAGGDHPGRLITGQQGADELGAALDDLFAVVQDEQRGVGQMTRDRHRGHLAGLLARQHGADHGGADELGVHRGRQVDPPRAADEVRLHGLGHGNGQARLARSARPAQRQQTRVPQQCAQLAQCGLASDQAGELGLQVAHRRAHALRRSRLHIPTPRSPTLVHSSIDRRGRGPRSRTPHISLKNCLLRLKTGPPPLSTHSSNALEGGQESCVWPMCGRRFRAKMLISGGAGDGRGQPSRPGARMPIKLDRR